jgi:Tol biopolymer transport system component
VENTVISSSVPLVNAKLTGDGTRIVYSNTDYGLFSVARTGGAASSLCERCGTLMGTSFDGKKATYEPVENEDLYVFEVAAGKSRKLADRHAERVILSSSQLSPDEKWVAFHSQQSPGGTTQVWIAPVHDRGTASREEWIPMGERESRDRDPSWASGGNLLFFLSERDGFRCIWARRIDARSKQPAGGAFAVRHFHSARQSLQHLGYLTGLTAGGGQIVFALGELSGNIWSLEPGISRAERKP